MLTMVVGAGCASAQASPGDGRQEGFDWSGVMPAGGTLEIKGVNGSIEAVPSPGSEVRVTAVIDGRRDEASQVRIERVEHGGGLTFCAVYPTPDRERENRCAPGEEGRMNVRDNDARVTFHVEVPAGVPVRLRNVNGAIEALGLASDVDVATVNGSVDLATTGTARARTVNGSIDASFEAALRDDASFETVNGRISLDLPDDLDADIDARWVSGGLESDLPIAVMGRMGRGRATGTLGQGGPTLRIATVNGAIRIR